MKFLQSIKPVYFFIFTILLSGLMHLHVFKMDLVGIHVWRQTQTQINIENFYKEDFNILNPRINDRGNGSGITRLEFPLMQWIFACFYKLFGNYIIITRILSFVIGIFSVLGIFVLLKNIFQNKALAYMGAWTFNFSPVFYYYTMNPLPDNFSLCCSVWGMAVFFAWRSDQILYKLFLSGFFLSLGALAKLPFVLFFIVPFFYVFFEKMNFSKKVFSICIFLSFIVPAAVWYVKVISSEWTPLTHSIFGEKQENEFSVLDVLQHNLISTLPELLVNYGSMIFFIAGFIFAYKNLAYKNPLFKCFFILGIAVLFYFFFELNLISKVHDYYLFPFLPLIFIIVAYGSFYLMNASKIWLRIGFFLLGILPATAFLRANSRWNESEPGFNADFLKYKNELSNAVPSDSLCVVGNDQSHNIVYYYVGKKGWAFENNWLPAEKLNEMIALGAVYLYSDSRHVDERADIKIMLDSLIAEKGSVRVYRLKKPSN